MPCRNRAIGTSRPPSILLRVDLVNIHIPSPSGCRLPPDGSCLEIRKSGAPGILARILLNIREPDGWTEGLRLPCLTALGVQLIDLLESQTLGLVQEEVNKCDAHETEASPDEEHLGLQVGVSRTGINQVRGRVRNGPIQEPVGRSRHGQAFCTCLEREELAY
jgi:hypothetical protein